MCSLNRSSRDNRFSRRHETQGFLAKPDQCEIRSRHKSLRAASWHHFPVGLSCFRRLELRLRILGPVVSRDSRQTDHSLRTSDHWMPSQVGSSRAALAIVEMARFTSPSGPYSHGYGAAGFVWPPPAISAYRRSFLVRGGIRADHNGFYRVFFRDMAIGELTSVERA